MNIKHSKNFDFCNISATSKPLLLIMETKYKTRFAEDLIFLSFFNFGSRLRIVATDLFLNIFHHFKSIMQGLPILDVANKDATTTSVL